MEKKEMFEEFKGRVDEILDHYEELERLSFTARLRNGTRFAFDFDIDSFNRNEERGRTRTPSRPVSVFNAVIDIIASVMAICLLIVNVAQSDASAATVLAFTSAIVLFAVSAVYHLFDERMARTVKVLFLVRMGLLSLTFALVSGAVVSLSGGSALLAFPVTLLFASLALFLTSLGTSGGFRAASAVLALMSLAAILFSGSRTGLVILTQALMCLSALVPATLPAQKSRMLDGCRTNGIFLAVALASFFLLTLTL